MSNNKFLEIVLIGFLSLQLNAMEPVEKKTLSEVDETLLNEASYVKSEKIKDLIKNGVNLDATNAAGQTAHYIENLILPETFQ